MADRTKAESSASAAEPKGEHLPHRLAKGVVPPGSFLVLRAEDGKRAASTAGGPPPFSVVLLHGWLQNLDAWLGVAQRLRDELAVDVLLVDFYAHGRSPCLRDTNMHTVHALIAQVRAVVTLIGWSGRGLVLGGMSMGASIAMGYALRFPASILGLLLLAPSGMPEHPLMPPTFGRSLSKALNGVDNTSAEERIEDGSSDGLMERLKARLNLVKLTPEYGVGELGLAALGRHGWPITVKAARYDILHTPHEDLWRRLVPQARVEVLRATHWWTCLNACKLQLERDPLWAEVRAAAAAADASVSSRL
eukprot:TRINITY_DN7624_c0_g1_i1.p1 TRINITY_DN7624_c0_g1~~TRINITY_DN7624_c0_g1_i1.p1  ORF type:complete len:345 (-),score=55.52 TRINITY_DN7624_c0_g1_i1:288-1205(-)